MQYFCNRRIFFVFVALFLGPLFLAESVHAAPATPHDYTVYPHLLQAYPSPGSHTAVVGTSAFGRDIFVVANELTGMQIGEIVAGEPVMRSDLNLPGAELDLAAQDWVVYVLKSTSEIQPVSVAIPEQPVAGVAVALPGEPTRMAMAGDRLYIACGSAGLAVFEIATPGVLGAPVFWGANVENVAVDGHRVAAVTEGRFDLVDFTDPAAPVLLGDSTSWGVFGNREVCLEGDIAWVSIGTRIYQLDISDLSAITATIDWYGRGRFYRDGSDLIIAQTGGGVINGIEFVDFVSGARKRSVGWFDEAVSATVLGGCIIGAGDDEILVIEDGARAYPAAQASETADYHLHPVGFCDKDVVIYFEEFPDTGLAAHEVGGSGGFLWQLDMGLGPDENLQHFAKHESLAAVLCSDTGSVGSLVRLRLASVSRHGAVNRGTLDLPGMVWDTGCKVAFLDAQTVIVLEAFDWREYLPHYLRVVDISNPDAPVQLDRVQIGLTNASKLSVSGDLILVSQSQSCEVVIAADRLALTPTGPRQLGQYVEIWGGRLFALAVNDDSIYSLDTWDLADPMNPTKTGSQQVPSVNPLHMGDGWAIQTFTGTLFDLTGPGHAVAVGNAGPQAWDAGFMVANDEFMVFHDPYSEVSAQYRFLAAPGAQGVVSNVEVETPRNTAPTLSVAPNPFNPRATVSFEMALAGRAVVSIHDLRGRLVRTLHDGFRGVGSHALAWDGTDAEGHSVAAGIYLVRVASGGGSAVQKVALVK